MITFRDISSEQKCHMFDIHDIMIYTVSGNNTFNLKHALVEREITRLNSTWICNAGLILTKSEMLNMGLSDAKSKFYFNLKSLNTRQ